ncbi:hypothetical protein ACFRAU_02745 [Arthrobacter sp. NPDC056691]|uniref:hypothetical protein n=1 Tax=Arthrobacter sp. NPDC056691 TaxID=3345913 RepID=UPI0036701AB6
MPADKEDLMRAVGQQPNLKFRAAAAAIALAASAAGFAGLAGPAQAASSKGCVGGGFAVLGKTGEFDGTVGATGGRFVVQGKYVRFEVDPANFAIYNYAFTGAANELDITGGRYTPVFASKIPDHRGLTLTGTIALEVKDQEATLSRTGTGGLSMTIQAKDCANGGLFQMEPERGDGTRTRIVHSLATEAFYFDNANFRARLGDYVGSACTSVQTGPPSQFCVRVRPRVNIGNNVSAKFAVRDSAQVADRVPQAACGPDFTNALGLSETRNHCGGMSVWDVASGGRMGMVTGEDATEVANSPTECVQDCQAQNQVRGRLAVLGFPFPVSTGSRLTPRTSTDGLTAPLTR